MNTPAYDACQIPLNPDVVATVQNTPAVPPVPSREAVEELVAHLESVAWQPDANGDPDCYDEGQARAADMLRTLLAEVKRLNKAAKYGGELSFERLQRVVELTATVAQLERTVADQAAALAERDKDASYYRWKLELVIPLFQEARDAITALSNVQIKLHGIAPDLDKRMDYAGTANTKEYLAALAASVSSATPTTKE